MVIKLPQNSRFQRILCWRLLLFFYSFQIIGQTCSDDVQNGTETGVDCGGSCPLTCAELVAAGCIGDTPIFLFDFTGNPNGTIVTPSFTREGTCCAGPLESQARCATFIVTLDPNTVGLVWTVDGGAAPGGSAYIQVDCGPKLDPYSQICLPPVNDPNNLGPYTINFCKPGGNANSIGATSIPKPDLIESDGTCSNQAIFLTILGFLDPVTVTAVTAGASTGDITYDALTDAYTYTTPSITQNTIFEYTICGAPTIESQACQDFPTTICYPLSVPVYLTPEVTITAITDCAESPDVVSLSASISPSGTYGLQWRHNSIDIPGENSPGLTTPTSGNYTLVLTQPGLPEGCTIYTNYDVPIFCCLICDDNNCNTFDILDTELCACIYIDIDPLNCNDGVCSNGVETWDGNNCICVDGLAPIPCADDNDCTNGFEVWNSNTCTCTITPPIFGCMNPDSENYDPNANCGDNSCVSPCLDPGCDDQNCLNGLESWDPLSCVCNVQPILAGCTDSQALNFNPNAMCEDGSCLYPLLYIPSAFSPNGDGINDVFRPVGGPILEFEMHIYDRWGKHYLSSTDPLSGWDGTLSGNNCEIGVYVYWMNVQIQGQQSRIYKGNITLIR